jgi:hypothetical protein
MFNVQGEKPSAKRQHRKILTPQAGDRQLLRLSLFHVVWHYFGDYYLIPCDVDDYFPFLSV